MKGIRINDKIENQTVRLVFEDKTSIVLSKEEAIKKAQDANLDLVEVVHNSAIPVCKIVNYEKYIYSLQKQEKSNKKKNKSLPIKEVKMGLKIDKGDYLTKMKHIKEFINDGHKVQITIFLKMRDKSLWDNGIGVLQGIINDLGDVVRVEQAPNMDKRRITSLVVPASKKSIKKVINKTNNEEQKNETATKKENNDTKDEE